MNVLTANLDQLVLVQDLPSRELHLQQFENKVRAECLYPSVWF